MVSDNIVRASYKYGGSTARYNIAIVLQPAETATAELACRRLRVCRLSKSRVQVTHLARLACSACVHFENAQHSNCVHYAIDSFPPSSTYDYANSDVDAN